MPRKRDPRRDEAYEIFKKHKGDIQNREIARQLNLPEKTIGGWKSKDRWNDKLNGVLQKDERSTLKNKGAPKGNRNAVGHGAPLGNKNAKGNSGGGAPKRNTNAVTTGEYQTLWHDALSDEELDMLNRIDLDPIKQLDTDIELYTWRERTMMLRLRDLNNGLSETQRRILKERRQVKDTIQVHDEKSAKSKTFTVPRYELVVTEDEETSYRVIDDILKIEDALTRVQDKKIKALELKYRITGSNGNEDTEAWVTALKKKADLRRKLKEEQSNE